MSTSKTWWICVADKGASFFHPVICKSEIPLSEVRCSGKQVGEITKVWDIVNTMKSEQAWTRPQVEYAFYETDKTLGYVWRDFYNRWFWNRNHIGSEVE